MQQPLSRENLYRQQQPDTNTEQDKATRQLDGPKTKLMIAAGPANKLDSPAS